MALLMPRTYPMGQVIATRNPQPATPQPATRNPHLATANAESVRARQVGGRAGTHHSTAAQRGGRHPWAGLA